MTSVKLILKNVLEWIIGANRYYSAAWTATSSSATGVQLTNSVSLPKGTYLIAVGSPYVTKAAMLAGLKIGSSTDVTTLVHMPVNSYSKASYIVNLTSTSSVYLVSQSSAATTFTNTNRGSLKAVRLCG